MVNETKEKIVEWGFVILITKEHQVKRDTTTITRLCLQPLPDGAAQANNNTVHCHSLKTKTKNWDNM